MQGPAGALRLRRSNRLRSRKDFLRVQREGSRATSRHFVLLRTPVHESADAEGPRLGITVSRKVASAVGRNRVKRRVREVFRHQGSELSGDLVVIARKGAAELAWDEAAGELAALLRKAGRP